MQKTERILYATGNAGKFREAQHALQLLKPGVRVEQRDPSVTEVQGSATEVTHNKVLSAYATLEQNELLRSTDVVLAEDVSLELDALGGFPSVYVKPMIEAIGDTGLADLAQRLDSQHCTARCTIGVAFAKQDDGIHGDNYSESFDNAAVHVVDGYLRGQILPECRGHVHHGKASWNACFLPFGFSRTFGELTWEEQATVSHRYYALSRLSKLL